MKTLPCEFKEHQPTWMADAACGGPSTHFIRNYFLTKEAVKKNGGSPHLFYCELHAKMMARINPAILGGPKIERVPERKGKQTT